MFQYYVFQKFVPTHIEYSCNLGTLQELSQNLLIRLNWVTHCQKAIWNCDGRLTMVSENLVRVKRRFAILEQINVSPTLYFKCLGKLRFSLLKNTD